MNAMTPTLVGIILFVNHILNDILCCSILIFRLMQRALDVRFVFTCSLLGGLPYVRKNLGLELGYLIQR